MAKRSKKTKMQPGSPKLHATNVKAATRAGSNAGRGFRYQDAVAAWLAIQIWADRREPATTIPEGGDDIELRGEETNFVQVKSRRDHLGDYPQGTAVKDIDDLWTRSLASMPQPERMELILERHVTGLYRSEKQAINGTIEGPIISQISKLSASSNLLLKTSITVATSPHECAISLITDRQKCSPIAAQMCFAALLVKVGDLADANGMLTPTNYRGLSISDTEVSIRNVLETVDVDSIERALKEGVCEPVDFLTPLYDPNFYLGVDVEPGHIAAGLVAERPQTRASLIHGIEERRAALIVGPSGAGKSALMWETANSLRHTVRWFSIRSLSATDVPAVRQLIRSFRASQKSPVGFVMDDIGRNNPENWGVFIKEAMSVPGVVLLGSVREEDVSLIAERARAAEVRADPDDDLAERLWQELREADKTNWAGWREPWKLSNGLLLEYVHILTRGRRMNEVLGDQVAARISDPTRSLELDILRSSAWAGAANAEIDASRLARTLSASEADLSRATQRLIQEHLVRSPSQGILTGLHQLRSEKLLLLTHQTPLPTLEKSFDRMVASVPAMELEPLVADTLTLKRVPTFAVINSLIVRFEHEPEAPALASALRGLGTGCISAGVDEWLETPEALALPRTQVGTAALFGITGNCHSSLDIIPGVQAAADRLSQIKGSPEDDPRRMLIERMASSALSAMIETADLTSLDEILGSLVGVPLSTAVRSALRRVPSGLLNANLELAGAVLGSLISLDREIAIQWVAEVGQEVLFAKIHAETAWAGPVSTENADDGVIVRCNIWCAAGSLQEEPHDAVVNLCELILALCPSADIAMSNALTASGELAGLTDLPVATKRIPRENLPQPTISQWNRRWCNLISRRVAAPSYSDYLKRGADILEVLVPTLEKIFDAHLRGKHAHSGGFETLKFLNVKTEALTPPAISSLEASGTGSGDANTAVTNLQNLLHSASSNLINRFTLLPKQAGAYIGWLNNLISDVDTAISEEPWQLVADCPPPALARLKALLETLRLLAGEAHERQESPAKTWAACGKRARANNAIRRVSHFANSFGKTRLAHRKAEIERTAAKAGVVAVFHLRINEKGILPWPPSDVLALLSASDVAGGVIVLDQQSELLRSLVESTIHLTITPFIDGVALPVFTKSGHQTLFPDFEGGVTWADDLDLSYTPSATVRLFGEVLNLAGELGSMDRLGLGAPNRPEEEVFALRSLETSLVDKRDALARRLIDHDQQIKDEIFSLIDEVLTGNVDFIAEAQATLDGRSTQITEMAGYLTVDLVVSEHNGP